MTRTYYIWVSMGRGDHNNNNNNNITIVSRQINLISAGRRSRSPRRTKSRPSRQNYVRY